MINDRPDDIDNFNKLWLPNLKALIENCLTMTKFAADYGDNFPGNRANLVLLVLSLKEAELWAGKL